MNLPPDEFTETSDQLGSPIYNMNDLNGPPDQHNSVVSNEDNTQYPTLTNVHGQKAWRRKAMHHQNTLSSFVNDIEVTKGKLESTIRHCVNADNGDHTNTCNSETFEKTPYSDARDSVHLRSTRTSRAHRQYVQHGDENIMFIYEPVSSTSKDYYRQIGNKNIMVHMNVNSSLCQLVAKNNGIIPLDTDGEVWLEIRCRNKQTTTDNVRGEFSETLNTDSQNPPREPDHPNSNNNYNIDLSETIDNNTGRRSPSENTEPKDVRQSPTEHTEDEHDSMGTLSDCMEAVGSHYSTLSIWEGNDALEIKFGKYHSGSLIEKDNLETSPILSHQKVLDFLSDKGNDFDVIIHDWEYEKDEVYSYISVPIDRVNTGYYDEGFQFPAELVPANRSVDEHTADFSTLTDEDMEGKRVSDMYSKPIKMKNKVQFNYPPQLTTPSTPPPSPSSPSVQRRPRIPRQNATDHVSEHMDVERKPTLPPRRNVCTNVKKENVVKSKTPEQKHPTDTCLLYVRTNISTNPPPLPLRSPTSPSTFVSARTTDSPPPLPERPPCQSSRLTPTEEVSSDVLRNPSPREKRQRQLPPPPGFADKENLYQYPWYHGRLEPGAGRLILANQEHGRFLVRDSNNKTDNHKYTIEFKDGNDIKKLMIVKTDDKYHFSDFNSKSFESVVDLVSTIIDTGLEVKDAVSNSWKTIRVTPASKGAE